MKKLLAILMSVSALAGCAVGGVGREFTWEQVQQIKPGMDISEVSELLGPPVHTAMTQNGTMVSWVYVPPVKVAPFTIPAKVETRQVSITFIGGKVVDTPK